MLHTKIGKACSNRLVVSQLYNNFNSCIPQFNDSLKFLRFDFMTNVILGTDTSF